MARPVVLYTEQWYALNLYRKSSFNKMTGRAMVAAMSRSGRATRDRILDVGLNILSISGFAGVTIGALASQVGMSKSGLFAHFKSKDEIDIALLEQMVTVAEQNVVAPAMRVPQGLARLTVLIDNWFGWSTKAGLLGGCPAAAGMFELDDVEGPVRDKLLELEKVWNDMLKQFITEAIDTGELSKDLDIEQFMWELTGFYLNHHASRRFMRDRDANMRARKAYQGLIDRSKPVGAKRTAKSR
jgi:AcrR family transcriptional regulator